MVTKICKNINLKSAYKSIILLCKISRVTGDNRINSRIVACM